MEIFLTNMDPHPPLSGFPLTLICLLLVAEGLGFKLNEARIAPIRIFLLSAMTLIVPLTYLSGLYAIEQGGNWSLDQGDQISHHQLMAKLILIIIVPVILFGFLKSYYPSKFLNIIYLLFILTTAILVAYTSFKGGQLVFKHGVGLSGNEKGITR